MRSLYDDIAGDVPAKAAVVTRGHEYSYAELLERIARFAGDLQVKGAAPGERVGIMDLSGIDFLGALYACVKIGATAVPLPKDEPARARAAMDAAGVRIVLKEYPTALSLSRCEHRPEAMVIFTSGTTSEGRKGVILGNEGISTTARFMNRAMGVDSSIRECVYAPLDHAFAFGRCHAVLMARGTILLADDQRSFEPLFAALEAPGTNALSTVPSVLASLLKIGRRRFQSAGAGLRWIQTGAMRFDRSFRNDLCESFPDARIYLHYGLSEAMRATFMELQSTPTKRHTEGRPADGVEICVLGENGEQLGPSTVGTIAIRGRNLALGYLNAAAWRAASRGGWFVTADRGMIDEDGYLVFIGRADDVINTNGHIVHPDEIEGYLHGLLSPRNFSVVGVPDPRSIKDKIIALAIEGAAAVSAMDVARAMSGAPDFMIPRVIVPIERFPRTRSGKVIRAQLSEQIERQLRR